MIRERKKSTTLSEVDALHMYKVASSSVLRNGAMSFRQKRCETPGRMLGHRIPPPQADELPPDAGREQEVTRVGSGPCLRQSACEFSQPDSPLSRVPASVN